MSYQTKKKTNKSRNFAKSPKVKGPKVKNKKLIKTDDILYFKEDVEAYPLDEKTLTYSKNLLRVIWAGSPCQYMKTKRIDGKFYHYFYEYGLPYVYDGPFHNLTKEQPVNSKKNESSW